MAVTRQNAVIDPQMPEQDQYTQDKALIKAKKRKLYAQITTECLVALLLIGLYLGKFLGPLFPPLYFICPIAGALIGAAGGYRFSDKLITNMGAESSNPVKPRDMMSSLRYGLRAVAGMGVGLAISILCPPLGLFSLSTQVVCGVAGAALGYGTKYIEPSRGRTGFHFLSTSNGVNLGAAIGGLIGFFIPLPGTSLAGAIIGGLIGAAIQYFVAPKPAQAGTVPSKTESADHSYLQPSMMSTGHMLKQQKYSPQIIPTPSTITPPTSNSPTSASPISKTPSPMPTPPSTSSLRPSSR